MPTIQMKRLIFIISIICGWASLNAASVNPQAPDTLTVSEAFIHISEQGLDIIKESVRRDMLDYMRADSIAKLPNIYQGQSWIEEMTPDYMRIHLTDASSLQLRVLETRNKKLPRIVMSIYTVGAEEDSKDSTIRFYDATYTALPEKDYFAIPKSEDFFITPSGSGDRDTPDKKELEQDIPFYLITYTVTPSSPAVLEGKLNLGEYLSEEVQKKYTPYIRPCLRWEWSGKKFNLIK